VHEYSGNDLPASVDWRDFGAASHVKNQLQCGGCWAFSSNAAVEGAWYIATNKNQSLSLSEQQIIDCTPSPADQCQGGNPYYAFNYMRNTAVCTEGSYEFTSTSGQPHTCKKSCREAIPKGGVLGSKSVQRYNVQALMDAVSKQPVAVAIAASKGLMNYHSGVFDRCGSQIDHSVLLVGYGTESGRDYWLIQNSWGESWGQGGFGKLLRSDADVCGVLQEPIYPVVDASKALPGMNPRPMGLTLALIFGGISATLVVIAVIVWGFTKGWKCSKGGRCCSCCKGRSRTVPLARVVPNTSMQHVDAPVAPLVGDSRSMESSPASSGNVGQKGNSRQSRLLK